MGRQAYFTLLLNDGYLKGAQVLARSLRDLGTTRELVIMVSAAVSDTALAGLVDLYDSVIEVQPISNPSTENLNMLGRLDLLASFTKLALWRQAQYEKIVFLDADTVVLQSIDHLFDLDVPFAAAPDIGWPDIFNSGVFFTKPSIGNYAALRRLAASGVSFDGGDQGLLNTFFPNFHRLSFTYNVTPSAGYQYLPAFRHFGSQIKVAHFIGTVKPWNRSRAESAQQDGPYGELLARWWAVYERHYSSTETVEPVIPKLPRQRPSPGSLEAIREELESPESNKFEAPNAAWDASKSSPPLNAQPEAAQLRFMSFSNSWDDPNRVQEQFIPMSTPKIPKTVHFEPPQPPSDRAPVFPWEGKTVAERVFPEDAIAPLQEVFHLEAEDGASSYEDDTVDDSPRVDFGNFQVSNAWDQVQEIKNYISGLPFSNRPRAPSSTWGSGSNTPREAELPEGAASAHNLPLSQTIPGTQVREGGGGERADFLLQDVAGLPKPQDWNPAKQLDELASHAAMLLRSAAPAGTTASPAASASQPAVSGEASRPTVPDTQSQ